MRSVQRVRCAVRVRVRCRCYDLVLTCLSSASPLLCVAPLQDTRRAMIKSFQTSGGTVLSTNWKEVAEKDYEKDRSAPAGQEMKDWNSRDRGSA